MGWTILSQDTASILIVLVARKALRTITFYGAITLINLLQSKACPREEGVCVCVLPSMIVFNPPRSTASPASFTAWFSSLVLDAGKTILSLSQIKRAAEMHEDQHCYLLSFKAPDFHFSLSFFSFFYLFLLLFLFY